VSLPYFTVPYKVTNMFCCRPMYTKASPVLDAETEYFFVIYAQFSAFFVWKVIVFEKCTPSK